MLPGVGTESSCSDEEDQDKILKMIVINVCNKVAVLVIDIM